jgi:glycosyltransferase involved in cell wall biosynthesis
MPPKASYVIATYARPDALITTLTSLVEQDFPLWEAIVVGDCCGPETERAIRSLKDSRISYYNLPLRFGEQSGPNSFGMRVVSGEYMCFLNHDDILFGDCLSSQLRKLEGSDVDMLFSRYVFADKVKRTIDGAVPIISAIRPASRKRHLLYSPDLHGLDPSSFWLIRTSFAKIVGPWKSARSLYRVPISDWLRRAWRAGAKLLFDDKILGMVLNTFNAPRASGIPAYYAADPAQETLRRYLKKYTPDEMREIFSPPIESKLCEKVEVSNKIAAAAFIYKFSGIDLLDIKRLISGNAKGDLMERLSVARVGAKLGDQDARALMRIEPTKIKGI